MSNSARISDLVAQDLRQKIDAGLTLPCPLTIAALAQHYEVSQSPIRAAVDQLLEWKFLCKLANGRLEVNRDKSGKNLEFSGKVLSPSDLEDNRSRVMEQMVEHIVLQSLAGAEPFLREEATAEKFQIGRAYARQIFSELAGRGLLEHVARRGWRIRPFSLDDMLQFLEIREVLECKALRLAAEQLEVTELQRMLEGNPDPNLQQHDWSEFQLNNEIHGYLIRVSGNRYIREFFNRNGLYYSTLFDLAAFDQSTRRGMAEQHRQILKALLKKKWSQAEKALAEHIRSQQPVVSDLLDQFQNHVEDASSVRLTR